MNDDNNTENKETTENTVTYEEKIKYINIISKPLASKKLTKKVFKIVKKATKSKTIKRGVKEVVKALRKQKKGLCIIAGDVSPVDVISHVPVLCEENDVPYIFIPSKLDLGTSACSKRPTSVILIDPSKPEFKEYMEPYNEVKNDIIKIQPVY